MVFAWWSMGFTWVLLIFHDFCSLRFYGGLGAAVNNLSWIHQMGLETGSL